jgi:hypothetical protein
LNEGTLTLTNSTISGNAATSQSSYGGGIYNSYLSTLTLNNGTISANFANHGGGIYNFNFSTANFKNTIIGWNSVHPVYGTRPDCGGTLISQGYILIQNPSGCIPACDFTGSFIGLVALLGPLQDNGGPTKTHTLLTSSPAIDAGNPATPGSGATTPVRPQTRGALRGPKASAVIWALSRMTIATATG